MYSVVYRPLLSGNRAAPAASGARYFGVPVEFRERECSEFPESAWSPVEGESVPGKHVWSAGESSGIKSCCLNLQGCVAA